MAERWCAGSVTVLVPGMGDSKIHLIVRWFWTFLVVLV